MKNNLQKYISIRNSIIAFFVLMAILIYSINQAKAGYWEDPISESWTEYNCEATQCGTTSGTKTQDVPCYFDEGTTPIDDPHYCNDINEYKTITISCFDAIISPCPTGTPTPTPTSKPNDPPSSPSSNPSASTCSNIAPNKSGANFHIYRKGSEAIAKWTPTAGNKVNIYYKQVNAKDWQYSVRDIENTGYYKIYYLGNLDITFALQQSNDCAGGPLSPAIVDGATDGWVLFR